MTDKLILAVKIKKFIYYSDKIIVNFPNSEITLKNKIKSTLYDTLELVYFTNSLNDKTIYQKKIISKIKMLDFYFKYSLDKKYISYKKYRKISNKLNEIVKMLYGWINEKSK